MEKTKKELALELIESLMWAAEEDDKEMTRLKRLEVPRYNRVGVSCVSHHLKVLKELVEQL